MNMGITFRFSEPSAPGTITVSVTRVIVGDPSSLIPLLEFGSLPGGQVLVPASVSKPNDALFRTFADTQVTREGIDEYIRRFASPLAPIEYGAVDKRGQLHLFVSTDNQKLSSDWPKQILDMRRCVQLWDLVRAGDQDRLARHIKWQADADGQLAVHYDSHPDLKPGSAAALPDQRVTAAIVSADSPPALFSSLRPNDVFSPAMLYIEARINDHLSDPMLTRASYIPQLGNLSLLSHPGNFLTGLWLQLAQAVAENKTYARCKECENWFETSTPGSRTTRMYCSEGCKVQAYIERKNRAAHLKAQGRTIREIADELGTDKDTVKRWLGRKR